MGENLFPFRRMTDPMMVPVSGSASNFLVTDGVIKPDYNAFCVVNPNYCWVRLRGSPTDSFAAVTSTTGWLFPPGFMGVFSTQYPGRMSALAVAMPSFDLPASFVPLEISYGYGS